MFSREKEFEKWEEIKDDIGFLLSQKKITPQLNNLFPEASALLRDSLKKGREVTDTTKLSPVLTDELELKPLEKPLEEEPGVNSQDLSELWNTCVKKIPELENPLSMESYQLTEVPVPTGIEFGNTLKKARSKKYLLKSELQVIGPYVPLEQIMRSLKPWKEFVMCSAVQRAPVNQEEHGQRQDWMLTLKIQDPNSGMGTVIKNMLLLTNFEETSRCPIYFDGLIGTHVLWRSKGLPPVW